MRGSGLALPLSRCPLPWAAAPKPLLGLCRRGRRCCGLGLAKEWSRAGEGHPALAVPPGLLSALFSFPKSFTPPPRPAVRFLTWRMPPAQQRRALHLRFWKKKKKKSRRPGSPRSYKHQIPECLICSGFLSVKKRRAELGADTGKVREGVQRAGLGSEQCSDPGAERDALTQPPAAGCAQKTNLKTPGSAWNSAARGGKTERMLGQVLDNSVHEDVLEFPASERGGRRILSGFGVFFRLFLGR